MFPANLITRPDRPAEGFYASEVESPSRLPVQTFLPTGYEPEYAYPLIVLFHGRGGSERQVVRLAPRLSRRNYIAIALRGPRLVVRRGNGRVGYGWGTDHRTDAFTEEYVFRAIELTAQRYHIHPARVFLAGVCEGAALAYRLGLSFPEQFAGVVALNGEIPSGGPLLRLSAVRRLQVFIGHGIANAVIPLALARRNYQLLYTAGLPVQLHTYPTTHRLHPDMLRDANRWIMEWITGER
jgi:phospholipase/carboxylesterase